MAIKSGEDTGAIYSTFEALEWNAKECEESWIQRDVNLVLIILPLMGYT